MLVTVATLLIVASVASATDTQAQGSCAFPDAVYDNYRLKTGGGKVREIFTENFAKCYEACSQEVSCSAVSYHSASKTCVVSYCSFIVLTADCDYETRVRGCPIVANAVLPAATHHFVLTGQCGLTSYGLSDMGISALGMNFDVNINNPKLGLALRFPGALANGSYFYVRTNPHPSIRVYSNIEVSFSIAFMISLDELNNVLCLTEIRNFASQSIHYWMWPDATHFHYNHVDSRYENLAYTLTTQTWHHFVITFDASSGLQRIWVDQKLVFESMIPWANRRLIEMLTIGGYYNGNTGLLKGSLYCYSLFNQALSESQLVEHKRACNEGHLLFLDSAQKCDGCC